MWDLTTFDGGCAEGVGARRSNCCEAKWFHFRVLFCITLWCVVDGWFTGVWYIGLQECGTLVYMDEVRSVSVQVRLRPSMVTALREVAGAEQRSVSDMVRVLIAQGLARRDGGVIPGPALTVGKVVKTEPVEAAPIRWPDTMTSLKPVVPGRTDMRCPDESGLFRPQKLNVSRCECGQVLARHL